MPEVYSQIYHGLGNLGSDTHQHRLGSKQVHRPRRPNQAVGNAGIYDGYTGCCTPSCS